MTSVQIVILAKAPVPGLAKTRLIPALGAAGAARLQRWLTCHALVNALAAQLGPVHLWCTPDVRHRFFRALQRRAALTPHLQPDGDLGQRMLAAFEHHCPQGPVLLIGTDCPALGPASLRSAAMTLSQADQRVDAVFVPVEDGGYALVGLHQPRAELFAGMTWSTDRVMAETRARGAAAGIVWREMPTLWDIDRPEDLARLQALRDELAAATAAPRAPAD
jgi:hypothetical protein